MTVPIVRGGTALVDVRSTERSVGIRSATTASSCQAVTGAAGLRVVLDPAGVRDLHDSTGQLIGALPVTCARVATDDVETGRSIANEHGESEVADVPNRRTDLFVFDGFGELVIRLELG